MAGLPGPYLNTMLQRILKHYYIYKADPAERSYMKVLYGIPDLPNIESKYWQTCRLVNNNYLLDIGRSANRNAVAILVYTHALTQPANDKNLVLSGKYKIPVTSLSPCEITTEAAIIMVGLNRHQKTVSGKKMRRPTKDMLDKIHQDTKFKALATSAPASAPRYFQTKNVRQDTPSTSTNAAAVLGKDDDSQDGEFKRKE